MLTSNIESILETQQGFKMIFKDVNEEMQACIQNCLQSSLVCNQMIQHCLQRGGEHADPDHLKLLQDCAEICTVSAHFMARESEYHRLSCGLCAEVCEACAKDCDSFDNDEMMASCASVCRHCAASCEKMALPQ